MKESKVFMAVRRMIVLFFVLSAMSFRAHAQMRTETIPPVEGETRGTLHADFVLGTSNDRAAIQDSVSYAMNPDRKSPLRAALYSAVIPGAGQLYSEEYIESAAFFAVEVAAWIAYGVYTSKGDHETADFQTYADKNWSVVRYVEWIQANFPSAPWQGVITNPSPDPSRPWESVDWPKLNACENYIAQTSTTGNATGFTHELPNRPEQQYYELIGKYPQFGGGWDDAGSFKPGGYLPGDILASNVSPHFLFYRDMRGTANSFYNIATTSSMVLVANHLLSALEAAWSAAMHNRNLRMESRLVPVRYGDRMTFMASATASIAF